MIYEFMNVKVLKCYKNETTLIIYLTSLLERVKLYFPGKPRLYG